MKVEIQPNKQALGAAAARLGAQALRQALAQKQEANIIVATGASQFEMLDALVQEADIDWSRVTVFHLDEYIGIPVTHPASFRKYLSERLVARLPALKTFIAVDGSAASIENEILRLNNLIKTREIDVCFAGIGENCHLAFNDPPADFETDVPYIVVELDEYCRRQQLGEGWFPTLEDVPRRAISMAIRQIARSKKIVLSVPDERKAQAVAATVEGPISNMKPASFLQKHADCTLFLDPPAASELRGHYS